MNDRESYFARARDWATDTRVRESRLLRIAWIVAGVAVAVALFEAVALAMLAPLKSIEPITLLVDRQTGYVQALDPLKPRRIGADEALTQAFLAQYVTAREGFDRATISADYRRVALWSTGLARAQYLALMPASNPESPLQRLGPGVIVTTRVKSVSPLSEGTALVRFDTQQQDRAGRIAAARPWIAVVRYRYSDAPMAFEDRLIDPLGFQVASYRRDPEAPEPAQTADVIPPSQVAQAAAMPAAVVRIRERPRIGRYVEAMPEGGSSTNDIPLGSPLAPPRTIYAQAAPAGQP